MTYLDGCQQLRREFWSIGIVPDYILTVQELYIKLAYKIVSLEQNLGVLSTVRLSKRNIAGLPSWVTDWTQSNLVEPILPHNSRFRDIGRCFRRPLPPLSTPIAPRGHVTSCHHFCRWASISARPRETFDTFTNYPPLLLSLPKKSPEESGHFSINGHGPPFSLASCRETRPTLLSD
jgi:hypothetical protein